MSDFDEIERHLSQATQFVQTGNKQRALEALADARAALRAAKTAASQTESTEEGAFFEMMYGQTTR
jgi:hypothetical protein